MTAPAAPRTRLPDRTVVPAVWSRYHRPRRRARRGLVAHHGRRVALPGLQQSGIGVVNTGHAHPRVVAAVQDQAAEAAPRPAEHRLPRARPAPVRAAPARAAGRAAGAPSCPTAGAEARGGRRQAGPRRDRPPGDHRLPRRLPRPHRPDDGPDDSQGVYRCAATSSRSPAPSTTRRTRTATGRAAGRTTRAACTCDWEAELDLLFQQIIPPTKVAAIIVEPVLGEGGYVVPPPGFLPRLREITRQHGILLVADEVQTGFGRTGRDVRRRALGRRAPTSWPWPRASPPGCRSPGSSPGASSSTSWPPGAHGGTFGGNVVACAAANATLDVIRDEGLPANAEARGAQLARRPAGGRRRPARRRRRPRPGLHGRPRVRQARRRRRPRRPIPTWPSGSSPRRSRGTSSSCRPGHGARSCASSRRS